MKLGLSLGLNSLRGGGLGAYAVGGNLPKLVMNNTSETYFSSGTRTTFDSLTTFARASTATYTDSTGTVQTATSGTPRLGHHVYEGGQWVNKGLLIESEARTNLFTDSEDFFAAFWFATRSSVSSDVTSAPDDTTTADKLIADNTVSSTHSVVSKSVTITAGANHEFSVFAKSAEYDQIFFKVYDAASPSNNIQGNFYMTGAANDASSGGTATLVNAKSEPYGNGWYRHRVFGSFPVTSVKFQVFLTNGAGLLFDGDGASGVYLWGALITEGYSSYIPPTGSTVTRAAATRSVASGDWPYSATAMSWFVEGGETYADAGTAGQVTIMDSRVDANNRVTLTLDTDGAKTGTFTLTVVNGGSSASVSTTNEITPDILSGFKVACTVTPTSLGICLNGTDNTAAHAVGIPDLSTADVDFEGMGTRADERMWDADIGAAGRQEVTS